MNESSPGILNESPSPAILNESSSPGILNESSSPAVILNTPLVLMNGSVVTLNDSHVIQYLVLDAGSTVIFDVSADLEIGVISRILVKSIF